MLLSAIKNISSFCCSLVKGKKKQGNGYLKPELQPNFPAGRRGQQTSHFSENKSRLDRLRKALTSARKNNNYQGYKVAGERKKTIFKLTAMISLACTFLLFLLIGGGQLIAGKLESASFFQVAEIVFSGTETIPEDTLRVASKIVLHQTSLFGLNCGEVEELLEQVPWVGKAEVDRNWPSSIEISIEENVPVALLHSIDSPGAGLHYIDEGGNPFLQAGPGTELDYPVVTGLLAINDPAKREKALKQALVLLKNINKYNNPHLPAQSVSEIHLTPKGEMVVYLVEYPFPIFFGDRYDYDKYERLIRVLKALYNKNEGEGAIAEIEYIQMDYLPNQVLVAQSGSK